MGMGNDLNGNGNDPIPMTDDDDRRRKTPTIVTSLVPLHCVGGPVICTYLFKN